MFFRNEAVRAQATPYLGSIKVGRRPAFGLVAVAAALVLASLIALLLFGTFARKAKVQGLLVPDGGEIKITSPQAGVVTAVLASESSVVAGGQTLLQITSDRGTTHGDTQKLVEDSLQQRRASIENEQQLAKQQESQHRTALLERITSMTNEQSLLDNELKTLVKRLDIARQTNDSYSKLVADGFMSQLQLKQQEDQVLDLTERLSQARRSLAVSHREQDALSVQLREIDTALQTTLSQGRRDLAAIDRESAENSSRGEIVIRAPVVGELSTINVHAGQSIQPGQPLATLLPTTGKDGANPLHARLFVPSRSVGFMKTGQHVWIRYAAFPYQKFGFGSGRVAYISNSALTSNEIPADQTSTMGSEPTYRVDVTIDRQSVAGYGSQFELKSGMTLEADIELDRRTILEFLFEPIIAANREIVSAR